MTGNFFGERAFRKLDSDELEKIIKQQRAAALAIRKKKIERGETPNCDSLLGETLMGVSMSEINEYLRLQELILDEQESPKTS